MGLFTRRAKADGSTLPTTNNNGRHHQPKTHEPFNPESGIFNRRPTFRQWLSMTWLDILTMIILGAVGLGIYMVSRQMPKTTGQP